MADAQGLGPCGRDPVEVQVLSPAQGVFAGILKDWVAMDPADRIRDLGKLKQLDPMALPVSTLSRSGC